MTDPASLPRPLEGLRVLDLSRAVAGPFAGRTLADLGADVVKVEGPEEDVAQHFGVRRRGNSGLYFHANAGKRSVYVDLKAEAGPDCVARLADRADLLVENYRPGVLARHGLDWEALSARNPRLLMLSISGFGQTGRDAGRPAFAPVIHAESGWLERNAALHGDEARDPGLSVADTIAALSGVAGLLAALHLRERTGRGQHLDVAMLHAFFAADDYVHYAVDGQPFQKQGGERFEAPGGPLFTGETFKVTWWNLSRAGLLEDPAAGERELERKVARRREAVQAWMLGFDDRDALEGALRDAGTIFGGLGAPEAVLDLAMTQDRGVVRTLPIGGGEERGVIDSPLRYSAARTGPERAAPTRGEHTAEVLREWLGLGDAEIEALEASGVTAPPPRPG